MPGVSVILSISWVARILAHNNHLLHNWYFHHIHDLCGLRTGGCLLPMWLVIDNSVWTDSWPSIVGAGCKFQLDWFWCKWRTNTKGLCEWASKAWFERPGGQRDQVRAAWWQRQQDEVVYGFLVESQN
jgi:hypothetical protein